MERRSGKLIGIEVKASASVGEADFKGLAQLADFVGDRLESGLVFYSGERVLPFRVAGRQFFAVLISLLLATLTGNSAGTLQHLKPYMLYTS